MSRRTRIAIGLLGACGLALLLLIPRRPDAPAPQQPSAPPEIMSASAAPLPGEEMLKDFADPARPPAEDLTLLSRVLDNFSVLAKGPGALPLGSNEELSAALRGEGRAKFPFLPRAHGIFDTKGRLCDRWGTPFFFHAESAQRLAIRSAGPDRAMWTADDLHRESNGKFLHGDALNPESLYRGEGVR